MFKNPLKYQKGGTAASQEQLVQLFQAAAENAQVDPQQLVQKASEIGQDEEAAAQFMQGLQLCAQGDPEGIKFIKSLFQKPTFRRGGKIYDFVCKHSKGGNINGCGCKEDGGKVAKAQEGGNWFTNATIGAAMAENPSVMTASGWRRDNSGNMVQDAISEPGVDKLRNNLAAISALSFTHPSNVVLNSTISRLLPALGTLKYFPTFGIHAALEGAGTSMQKKETPNPVAGNRFKAPTNYYNEKGWQISEEDALRRKNRTFYTEEPTASGNLSWSNNEMAKQLMWPGVQQDVQYNQPVGHYIDEYGNMHDFSVEGNDLTRYNNRKAQWKKCGGKIEKAQGGKKVNNNRRTITEVGHGLDEYDAKKMGIDPNTLAGTSSIITAYPNKKPYVVDGQVPFWTRNGLVFDLGGVEAGYIEDGTRMSKGVPGRKYKVSSVLDQDGLLNFSYNENAKEFPMISRFASPKDTIYYLNFNDFDKNTLGYEEVRSMYNKAIDQPDTFALNKEAYLELQRQKQERASKKENSGKVEK